MAKKVFLRDHMRNGVQYKRGDEVPKEFASDIKSYTEKKIIGDASLIKPKGGK